MAYATRPDIEQLIAQFQLGQGTNPTAEQADSIIAQISSEIDGILGTFTAVPVTVPAYFVSFLSAVNSWGAAAAILKSMFPASTGQGENPAWSFWQKKYESALKMLMDKSGIPDELKVISKTRPSTYFTRNPNSEEFLGDIAEPSFKRSQVF